MSANDRQPGGDHYRRGGREYQHWDLMADLDAGYFPAVITKYAERHELKAGLLDLQKAGHYAEKWGETEAALRARGVHRLLPSESSEALVEDYIAANKLDAGKAAIFRLALLYAGQRGHELMTAISVYTQECYPEPGTAEDGGHHAKIVTGRFSASNPPLSQKPTGGE